MSDGTKISWADATWNPVVGCTPVSAGCANCYAGKMARRLGAMGNPKYLGTTTNNGVFNGVVRMDEAALTIPLHWKKPRNIFVCSMGDLYHPAVPFAFIDRVKAVEALCPQHTFLELTKRPERMAEYLVAREKPEPLPNVWLGTSVENQAAADERIPWLLKCPAKIRFLSCEPLISGLDLRQWIANIGEWDGVGQYPPIDWVIVGGESGPGARPCDVGSIRSIVRQCREAGVPVFVKQMGDEAYDGNASGSCVYGSKMYDQCRHPCVSRGVCESCRRLMLRASKGGDPAEWPEDMRVRELPKGGVR